LLREKLIDVPGRFSKSALSLQVRAGRGNSITLGIENRDVITVVVRPVKYKLVTVIPMGAAGHVDLLNETWIRHRMAARQLSNPPALLALADEAIDGKRSLWVIHDRCIRYPCQSMSVVTPIATLLFGAAKRR
jgi:hypothetical protein